MTLSFKTIATEFNITLMHIKLSVFVCMRVLQPGWSESQCHHCDFVFNEEVSAGLHGGLQQAEESQTRCSVSTFV